MKIGKDVGASLGFLAGTTLGSGISFLYSMTATPTITTVSVFGVIGTALGIMTSMMLQRKANDIY
ncbi:hypothetical protein PASE110613_09845 [Paenibacillus sediminis]|uniref:Glycine zipper family protein n=1 Tax=Paenibacillus sediminis TaxID=664909 RepID=A0ABS4H5H8_9BACL|nr:hypothetical protein [Paenibacillus sediminis]MBP1937789.1 hypothetical protein [Paenibacillus sediminis]